MFFIIAVTPRRRRWKTSFWNRNYLTLHGGVHVLTFLRFS